MLVPFHVDGGEEIMHQGDTADSMYIVHRGRLRARMGDPEPVVLGEAGRGELVGEMALISERPTTATVIAVRDGELLRLSTDALTQVVRDHPEALREIMTRSSSGWSPAVTGSGRGPAATLVLTPLADAPELIEAGRPSGRSDGSRATWRAWTRRAPLRGSGRRWRMHPRRTLAAASPRGARSSRPPRRWSCTRPTPRPRRGRCCLKASRQHRPRRSGPRPSPTASSPWRMRSTSGSRSSGARWSWSSCTPSRPTCRPAPGRWLDARQVARHHHVRLGIASTRTAARLLTGRGIGLVLSGGGA